MKRFYKETAVEKAEDGWRVLLDGKPMRTPAKSVLVVPTDEELMIARHTRQLLSAAQNGSFH